MSDLIRAESLQKCYRTGEISTAVLRGVDLSVRRGECIFLVGPSGCGKTTLLSILGCVLSPDSGSLQILGEQTSRWNSRQLAHFRREHIGFVFQRFHLFGGLRAWENVRVALDLLGIPPRTGRQQALELLDRVGLADRANHRISQLSMGQRQRVALARALAGDPELILADEPTASLDAESGWNAMTLLKTLCTEMSKTVVVVTHDERIMPLADRVHRLEEGRIATGEPTHSIPDDAVSSADAASERAARRVPA